MFVQKTEFGLETIKAKHIFGATDDKIIKALYQAEISEPLRLL